MPVSLPGATPAVGHGGPASFAAPLPQAQTFIPGPGTPHPLTAFQNQPGALYVNPPGAAPTGAARGSGSGGIVGGAVPQLLNEGTAFLQGVTQAGIGAATALASGGVQAVGGVVSAFGQGLQTAKVALFGP